MKLNYQTCKQMIAWASIFSTWWGFSIDTQESLLEKFVKDKIPYPELKGIQEFDDTQLLACVYGVWPAWTVSDTIKQQALAWLKYVNERYQQDLHWLVPVETGIEMMVLGLSWMTNIPLVDADIVWGRAVPELQYDNFLLASISVFPIIAVDKDLHIHYLEEQNIKKADKELRRLVTTTWGSLICIDHICTANIFKEHASAWALSRSILVWAAIENDEKILPSLGTIVSQWIVNQVNITKKWWFLQWTASIFDDKNTERNVIIKNEYMEISSSWFEASFPDLICIIDKKTSLWVSSYDMQVGQEVVILYIEAESRRKWYKYSW